MSAGANHESYGEAEADRVARDLKNAELPLDPGRPPHGSSARGVLPVRTLLATPAYLQLHGISTEQISRDSVASHSLSRPDRPDHVRLLQPISSFRVLKSQ